MDLMSNQVTGVEAAQIIGVDDSGSARRQFRHTVVRDRAAPSMKKIMSMNLAAV